MKVQLTLLAGVLTGVGKLARVGLAPTLFVCLHAIVNNRHAIAITTRDAYNTTGDAFSLPISVASLHACKCDILRRLPL